MGYDIHIRRGGEKITLEEWLRYVESDSQIQRDPQNNATDFLFVAHPKEPAPLWWQPRRSEIYTKDPDKATVQKMIEIAQKIGARVQGDEGEFYDDTSKIAD